MITFREVLEAMESGGSLFFRGPRSRKPYKVTVFEIERIFMKAHRHCRKPTVETLKKINPQDIEDVNVVIVFTNGDTEVVSLCYLFMLWKDAAEVRPIRQPKCNCGNDPNCKDWRHWYEMSPVAKELMLKENPGYNKTDLGGGVVVDRPPIIPGGWGYYWSYSGWFILDFRSFVTLCSS